MQHGKCMYCGQKIDLNDLSNNNKYDLDHIHPRSLKADDSLRNNLVLVCKTCNQEKGKDYPLKLECREKMSAFWKILKDKGFIEKEKYDRLTRSESFNNDELSGFINRQLVETSQSVKAVAETLKRVFEDKTDIVYVKANTVSDFRNGNNGYKGSDANNRLKFIKCRSVNDYHHAKDAYLNIVIGNVYDTKFTKNYKNFVQTGGKYNLREMFDYDIERNGVQAWKAGNDGTIATVQKYMKRNNILFTRFSYQVSGQLYDLNPLKKGEGQLSLKSGLDIEKYGGYNNLSGSYYSLVEHTKNKKRIRTIQPVLLCFVKDNISETELANYMEQERGLEKPVILIKKILKFSTFEINGFRGHISGRQNDNFIYYCAEQLILSEGEYDYCKRLEKYIEKSKELKSKEYIIPAKDYGLSMENNILLFNTFKEKYTGSKYGIFFKELIGQKLEDLDDKFQALSTENQAKLLTEILHGFQCNSATVKLKEIGGSETGKIIKSNNIENFDSIKLIYQSPSGLFENEIDLKKL
jgi:CRISPR-associated protein Cas9/Csn1, subtype II/NMEMI